jgi:hypothetical protein
MRSHGPLVARSVVALSVLFGAFLTASSASAEGFDASPDDAIAAQSQAELEKGKRMPGEKVKAKAVEEPSDPKKWDPSEDPMKSYYFVGFRFRDVVVPKFMINLFADGGRTVNAPSYGLEFGRRKDNTEIDISISYADYSMDPFLFKAHNDGPEAYELVESQLKLLNFNVDMLWNFPLDDKGKFSFLVGGGIGLGGVLGDLYRWQVYPAPGSGGTIDPANPSSAANCPGAIGGGVYGGYCDGSNEHFNANGKKYSEPSWLGGGSKPVLFPWISIPQLSFRYKPVKQVAFRADTGFSTSGFFFGFSGAWGLPLGGNAPSASLAP